MNKICLTLLGALFLLLPCKSQTLTDGKVWNYVQKMYEHDDFERAYSVTVSGDTIANGLLCKKLVKVYQDTPNARIVYARFEKDSKVYGVYGEETKLLMDFSLNVGDKANEVGTVVSVAVAVPPSLALCLPLGVRGEWCLVCHAHVRLHSGSGGRSHHDFIYEKIQAANKTI